MAWKSCNYVSDVSCGRTSTDKKCMQGVSHAELGVMAAAGNLAAGSLAEFHAYSHRALGQGLDLARMRNGGTDSMEVRAFNQHKEMD